MRKLLDRFESDFHPGGKWERLYPLFEAIDTFLYKPKSTTKNSSHVRDNIDLKRVMITVKPATFPAMFFGMWNIGFTQQYYGGHIGMSSQDGIRGAIIGLLSAGYDATSVWDNMIHGAAYFLPIYITTFVVGITWEIIFATVRKHEVNEGFFVTSILFSLSCPPDLPLWMVAIGISFGVVIGKEILVVQGKFSKSGFNWKGLLIFAYPAYMSGDAVWTAVDGYSGATMLSLAASKGLPNASEAYTWMESFIGTIPGSIGETSTLAILLGGFVLLYMKIASLEDCCWDITWIHGAI